MIKFNNSNINDWYFYTSDIVKVYRNNAICYYKINTSGDTPTPVQEPCFAVVDDISQYSDTEFEDVFNKADGKWYKLNNLNQYEEYGVYGSGRTITTYEGKLTIDGDYEYIYSGGSWTNVGEISGSSITIKSPEYIEKDSSHNGKINLDYVWKTNSKMQFKFYSTSNGGGAMIGEDANLPDNNDCRMFFASTTAYFDWGSSRISWSSNGRTNTLYEYEYGNYYIKNMVTSASKTGSTISTSRTNPLYFGQGGSDRFRTYYLKFYDGDTLVKDFIPWTDMNGNYGLFDKVSLSVYNVASGTLTGSSNVTDVEVGGGYEYPLEYVVREDPPDNLVFSTMTEAEAYECPYVGMKATINGDKYVFTGDSISGYEWVYQPSRLPAGYTEVEYIENVTPNKAYIDTGFKPNQNTRVIADLQYVATNIHPRAFGCGTWNSVGYIFNAENGIPGEWRWKFGSNGNAWLTTGVASDFNRHKVEINNGNLYLDDVVIGSTTVTTFQLTDNIGLFCFIQNGSQGGSSSGEYMFGKFYSFKIYDDGVLTMDFVPCINPNNVVGMYDIVGGAFYSSANAYTFVAGPAVN